MLFPAFCQFILYYRHKFTQENAERQIRDTVWIQLMAHGPHRHQQNWKWAPAIFAFTPKASWKVEQLLGHHSVSHREGDLSTLSEVDVFLCPSGGWQSLRSHLVGRDSDGLFAQTHQCIEPFIRYVGTALRACTIIAPPVTSNHSYSCVGSYCPSTLQITTSTAQIPNAPVDL